MVLLIPHIDSAKVRQARAWLAEVQGYARIAAPVAMLFPATRVSVEQWKHLCTHGKEKPGEWLCMDVPARSEWGTLLLFGESSYLFSREGAVCYYPERAVADKSLFRGTVLAGDYTSDIVDGRLVYTFRAVHALVSRGMLIMGLPLHLRMQAAQRALAGLRNLVAGNVEWRHELAAVRRAKRANLQPGWRFLHAEDTPDMSSTWGVECKQI